jgi:hypothetical protein
MKPAPNFKQWPDAVDGRWKINFLRWLQSQTGIQVLLETGTCEGITPANLHDCFREIHTIELHPGLYENARNRLKDFSNVKQYFGSSRNLLIPILKKLGEQPILFWLDAHSSGPHTADDGDVLPYEIETITWLCPDALIVIDDMKDATLHQELDPPGWHREFRTGEIVMFKQGRYTIPPFEAV